MTVSQPSTRLLRRSFQTGLWVNYRVSTRQVQLHVKVNRIQIDSQMPDCIFPVVFAPVPPPHSVAADKGGRKRHIFFLTLIGGPSGSANAGTVHYIVSFHI